MATKNEKYSVSDGLMLTLESLWAEVRVSVGQSGVATVELEGDEKLLKQIHVSGNASQVTIKGEGGDNGGITVISGRGNSVVSVGNIRGGGVVISGGSIHVGGNIVAGRNLVVVNGKVISGGDGDVTVVEGGKMPTITVKVPKGTDLEVYDVERLTSKGLGGRVDVSLSGTSEATITDANGMKVKCSGQSQCVVENATGDLKADTSGQSGVDIVGNIGDVNADCSGQSHISINGNCHDFNGETSGQSHISVSGKATGRVRQRNSAMSRISVRQG